MEMISDVFIKRYCTIIKFIAPLVIVEEFSSKILCQ